ncbi:hypothetical protein CCP3SC15_580005 [Gammaproteobacteria bacterium]
MNARPLSSEVREAQKACRDLLAMADNSPFGPRGEVADKIFCVEHLLARVLDALTGEKNVDFTSG